ncbi:hypothetical protein A9Q81_06235 [Gammaproteobacteria bacterium 42_54_T18]|nr:hypothetical protein A9Q81_06235 [Gammaproteobacteria bacterium 42_54_T18]
MSDELKLKYHEIDFIVPVHRFNIQFSYVTKQGLSFIREFVLRLVQLAPMKPTHIATYLGLNKIELNEAISDLMDKGELQFSELGSVILTPKSEGYFEGLGKPPKTSSILETGTTLSFELAGFNCLGKKRISDKWNLGIALQISNEIKSTSEKLAKSVFQKNFYNYFDKEWLNGIRVEGDDRPSIYTMDSVSKLGQDPLRLTNEFYIDLDGNALEREDFDVLDDSTKSNELITTSLSKECERANIPEIANAMKLLGDDWTCKFFNNNSIDVSLYAKALSEAQSAGNKPMPIVGPVYSKNNWGLVIEQLKSTIKGFKKSKNQEIKELLWIAPSDSFWGKSSKLISCLHDLASLEISKEKQPQRIFEPKLFVPLSDMRDRRALGNWKNDLGKDSKLVFGLLEGFLSGNVEVFVFSNEFAVINYHISRPEILPVSMPVGFITTDRALVSKINNVAQEYINGAQSHDKVNNLGLLSKL